jgi:hypothetical protein
LDRLVADPDLNGRFIDACRHLGLPGDARTWNWILFRMRKAGDLAHLDTQRRTEFSWRDCEPYLFASEIAWRQMIDQGHQSLDHILTDPGLAAEFDQIAARWAPGHTPLEYRWAAMRIRKMAKTIRARASILRSERFRPEIELRRKSIAALKQEPAVYLLSNASDRQPLYAGETSNLRARIELQCGEGHHELWRDHGKRLTLRFFLQDCPTTDRLAYQRRLVQRNAPRLNLLDQGIA